MNRTSTMTLQTIWDCRWSRVGYRLTGVVEKEQPEPIWVCVRYGDRRAVTEDVCATCVNWQADDTQH